MKKITPFILLLALTIFLAGCNQSIKNEKVEGKTMSDYPLTTADTVDATNYFYDNAETYPLSTNPVIVNGEIVESGEVDFSVLPLHTVIVKEARLSGNGNEFIGAYRYDGYSLMDILNQKTIDKANAKEFEPIIDLYVEIANQQGEKVIVSWGEIYYPNHLHEILIATRVMRIVPSKTNDLWPLPSEIKLVFASDLLTERNISAPSKITVRSYPRSFETIKGKKPLFSEKIDFMQGDEVLLTLDKSPDHLPMMTYESIFYGRGRGIHSTQPFNGTMLKQILEPYIEITAQNLKEGFITVKADDGYRGVFTVSEVMNRNDQSEVLLIYQSEEEDGGRFRLFPACDFFSDRAIKAISEIYLELPE
jgi:hypothetical protein